MQLVLCEDVTRNDYLSVEDFNKLKEIVRNYLIETADKDENIADTYVSYGYKSLDCVKFVSLILIELNNKPYFIEEVFYNKSKDRIFAKGEYAGVSYNFELV